MTTPFIIAFDGGSPETIRLIRRQCRSIEGNYLTRLNKRSIVWAYTRTAHHRRQAVVYLRVQGIKPPSWKFEPAAG